MTDTAQVICPFTEHWLSAYYVTGTAHSGVKKSPFPLVGTKPRGGRPDKEQHPAPHADTHDNWLKAEVSVMKGNIRKNSEQCPEGGYSERAVRRDLSEKVAFFAGTPKG